MQESCLCTACKLKKSHVFACCNMALEQWTCAIANKQFCISCHAGAKPNVFASTFTHFFAKLQITGNNVDKFSKIQLWLSFLKSTICFAGILFFCKHAQKGRCKRTFCLNALCQTFPKNKLLWLTLFPPKGNAQSFHFKKCSTNVHFLQNWVLTKCIFGFII